MYVHIICVYVFNDFYALSFNRKFPKRMERKIQFCVKRKKN